MTNQKQNLKRKKSKQEQHILNIESTVWNITESATDHLQGDLKP